ncbi:MAG: ABC transporter permease [Anaerolineae bacterium]
MVASKPQTALTVTERPKVRSHRSRALMRFWQNKAGVAGAVIVVLMLLFAFGLTLFIPFPGTNALQASKMPLEAPGHILGTDIAGRDMVGLLAHGTRTSLIIALAVQFLVVFIAVILGFSAGWFGGRVDFTVNRAIEIFTAIPVLLFSILFILVLGNSVPILILAIGFLAWVELARLVRGQVLQTREKEYIEAAKAVGVTTFGIAWKHVLPNILNPIIIAISLSLPAIILAESTLSFLGYGLSEGMPSLGKMVGVSWQYIQAYWHMALLPTIFLSVLMIGITFFGDGLRDALDPRASR